MKIPFRILILSLVAITHTMQSSAQYQYRNFGELSRKTESLAREFPALCSVKSLVKTAGGKDILVLAIGTGEKDQKPGIAIVGGIEGNYLTGRELALGFAEN